MVGRPAIDIYGGPAERLPTRPVGGWRIMAGVHPAPPPTGQVGGRPVHNIYGQLAHHTPYGSGRFNGLSGGGITAAGYVGVKSCWDQ